MRSPCLQVVAFLKHQTHKTIMILTTCVDSSSEEHHRHERTAATMAIWFLPLAALAIMLIDQGGLLLEQMENPTHRKASVVDADLPETLPLETRMEFVATNYRLDIENADTREQAAPPVTYSADPLTQVPLAVMDTYMQQHSNQQLLQEVNDCQKNFTGNPKDCPALAERKFMVAYYSCPNQGGNRMHHFLNAMFWGIVSNRTVLWHYYDKETCQDIGAAHNPKLCDMVETEEYCSQILQRADWIPSAEKWTRTLNLSSPELASWWSTHLPPRKDKTTGELIDNRSKFIKKRHPWHDGDEKYTGIDVYSQRVLRAGQQHSWEASMLMKEENRRYLLNTTQAQQRAEDLLSLDLPFFYGMLFDHSFSYTPAMRPDSKIIADSTKMTTIGLHSRHALITDDGSDVTAEKKCLVELLDGQEGPCAVYIMSDRDATVKLLKNHVEHVLMCDAIVDSTPNNDNTTTNAAGFQGVLAEMGSNPGGFWKELALVSSARYGFIGLKRSSSHLLQEQMHYHALVEGMPAPKACYLPDPEHVIRGKKKKSRIEVKD